MAVRILFQEGGDFRFMKNRCFPDCLMLALLYLGCTLKPSSSMKLVSVRLVLLVWRVKHLQEKRSHWEDISKTAKIIQKVHSQPESAFSCVLCVQIYVFFVFILWWLGDRSFQVENSRIGIGKTSSPGLGLLSLDCCFMLSHYNWKLALELRYGFSSSVSKYTCLKGPSIISLLFPPPAKSCFWFSLCNKFTDLSMVT